MKGKWPYSWVTTVVRFSINLSPHSKFLAFTLFLINYYFSEINFHESASIEGFDSNKDYTLDSIEYDILESRTLISKTIFHTLKFFNDCQQHHVCSNHSIKFTSNKVTSKSLLFFPQLYQIWTSCWSNAFYEMPTCFFALNESHVQVQIRLHKIPFSFEFSSFWFESFLHFLRFFNKIGFIVISSSQKCRNKDETCRWNIFC